MTALVELRGDQVRASSLVVADTFGRRHGDVLKSIRGLVEQEADLERNFSFMIHSTLAGKGARRETPYCEMDRDGFSLLAMGFTGPKALKWKMAFIAEFNRMEAALTPAIEALNDDESEDQGGEGSFLERLRSEPPVVQISFVREMRLAKGRSGAIRAMEALGWEAGGDDPLVLAAQADPVLQLLAAWLNDRTERQAGNMVQSSMLYRDYVRWSAGHGAVAVSNTAFSLGLQRLGVPIRRSGVSRFIGLRLKD